MNQYECPPGYRDLYGTENSACLRIPCTFPGQPSLGGETCAPTPQNIAGAGFSLLTTALAVVLLWRVMERRLAR